MTTKKKPAKKQRTVKCWCCDRRGPRSTMTPVPAALDLARGLVAHHDLTPHYAPPEDPT